jgi:hypothetical protein
VEELLEGVGVTVPVGVAEAREEPARGPEAQRLDELAAEDSQDVGIVEQHPLIVERDDPVAGAEIEQLGHLQLAGPHG